MSGFVGLGAASDSMKYEIYNTEPRDNETYYLMGSNVTVLGS